MSKFKVGDKVRILDGSKIENYAGGWTTKMGRYIGEVYKVANVVRCSSGSIMYRLEGVSYGWDERGLERVVNETIVIYRKDNEVIALDKATGKKAIAKCSREDTFDFNIGAKLAFERLMNGNKESVAVEDMRKKLNSYCGSRTCKGCKLIFPVCRCGCGVSFNSKTPTGKYKMSDEEIKDAFNTAFSNGIKEIKRRAKKGERVKIVDAIASYGNYKNGDILKIVDDVDYVRYGYCDGQYLHDSEYVVLEGYKPDKQDEPKEQQCKFNVGERYRVCIGTEKGNTIEITETKGDRVFYKIISGKPGITGNNFDRNSLFAKSLVMITQKVSEEPSKLYNGKIIFTKGDGMFKTGHIYEVNNGKIVTLEYGSLPISEPLKDIEDVKDYFTGNLDGNRKREKGWSPYTLELMEVKED